LAGNAGQRAGGDDLRENESLERPLRLVFAEIASVRRGAARRPSTRSAFTGVLCALAIVKL